MRIHTIAVAVVSVSGAVLTVSPAMASPAAADVITLEVASRPRPALLRGTATFYPLAYGWQRLQELARKAETPSYRSPLDWVNGYDSAQALRAYRIADAAAVGTLALLTPEEQATYFASLTTHVTTTRSFEGLLSVFFTGLASIQHTRPDLFAKGISLWTEHAPAQISDHAVFFDVEGRRIGILSAGALRSLCPGEPRFGHLKLADAAAVLIAATEAGAAQDGATSCEQVTTAISGVLGAIAGTGAGFVGGGLAGGAAGTVTLPVVGTVGGATWGAGAGATAGFLAGSSGGKDLGDAVGPVICGWINPSGGGTGGASNGNSGPVAPTTEGQGIGHGSEQNQPSSEQNQASSAQGTGGQSSDQNQSSEDTSGGGNDSEDTTCHFPNPEDFPNPDDSRGFQLPTPLMNTAMAAQGLSERAGQNGYEVSRASALSSPASTLRIIQTGVPVLNVGNLFARASAAER